MQGKPERQHLSVSLSLFWSMVSIQLQIEALRESPVDPVSRLQHRSLQAGILSSLAFLATRVIPSCNQSFRHCSEASSLALLHTESLNQIIFFKELQFVFSEVFRVPPIMGRSTHSPSLTPLYNKEQSHLKPHFVLLTLIDCYRAPDLQVTPSFETSPYGLP